MGGCPSRSHIQNQHTWGSAIAGNLAWIASFKVYKLNLACPGLATLRTWTDSPDNLSELMNDTLVRIVNGCANSNTYPFDCREHAHGWVSISLRVQICIDHVRISICCCIVVMIPWERPCNVVLIVSTSRSSFLAIGPRYCPDPFQELNKRLDISYDDQET